MLSTKLLCSHSHCVTTQGPGQECWWGAEHGDRTAPTSSGKGDWVQDGDFPPKGGGQTFIYGFQWLCDTERCSPPVPPANPQRQEPLLWLLPAAAYAEMSSPWGQQSWHHRVPPLALSLAGAMEETTLHVLLMSSSDEVCFVRPLCWHSLCVTLAARPPRGKELPEEAQQRCGRGQQEVSWHL